MILLNERAKQNLSLSIYANAGQRLHYWLVDLNTPQDQYILRMPILTPDSKGWQIPDSLNWIYPALNIVREKQMLLGVWHPFVYVTVRAGVVRSTTDDLWHVDGFSMRKPHAPEQNYIWSDVYGTEFLPQNFDIPADFDAFKHNLHQYFQDRASVAPVTLNTGCLYQIDPYNVHRRPTVPKGTQRTFLRISFVPVEIEDDTCMQNPLMAPRAPYNREDIRKTLVRY
jgi:hypothetical protein